jgi:hypothetical protein
VQVQNGTDLGDREMNVTNRFETFFDGVPLHGGDEWKSLEADEIVAIFKEAAAVIKGIFQERHDTAIAEHSRLNLFVRFWSKIRGWRAPVVPTDRQLFDEMIGRCNRLADWAKSNRHRQFYEGCELEYLIKKPREVARLLAQ